MQKPQEPTEEALPCGWSSFAKREARHAAAANRSMKAKLLAATRDMEARVFGARENSAIRDAMRTIYPILSEHGAKCAQCMAKLPHAYIQEHICSKAVEIQVRSACREGLSLPESACMRRTWRDSCMDAGAFCASSLPVRRGRMHVQQSPVQGWT
jgi:hypothetical protein